MRRRRRHTRGMLAAVAAGAIVVSAGYGLTAANTVPASRAGEGTGAISGYAVSGIDYTLLSADPSRIDLVTFNLDASPAGTSQIRARIAGSWYSCTNVGAAVTCDFPGGSEPAVTGASSLQVVVAD